MISFQKICGLYGLEHHTVEINGDVSMRENLPTKQPNEDRATQLMDSEHWLSYFQSPRSLFVTFFTRSSHNVVFREDIGFCLFRWSCGFVMMLEFIMMFILTLARRVLMQMLKKKRPKTGESQPEMQTYLTLPPSIWVAWVAFLGKGGLKMHSSLGWIRISLWWVLCSPCLRCRRDS